MVIYLTSDGHTATNSIKITTNDDQAKVIPEFDENFIQLKNRIIIIKAPIHAKLSFGSKNVTRQKVVFKMQQSMVSKTQLFSSYEDPNFYH